MVSSLQSIVLFSVPIAVLIEMLKILHHLPMGHELFRALFRRCTHEELRDWAKTFPWDHPIARKLDHEVHRRRMAGEFYSFHFSGCGSLFSLYLFLIFHRGIQGVRVSTNRAVAYPPMSLPSTCPTQLGRAVLGSNLFVLIFFLFVRFLGICGKSACVPHLPVGRPSHPWWGLQPLRKNDGWLKTG